MNTLCKAVVTSATFFFASSIQANDITGKIVDLIVWQDGNIVIKLDNGPINGCPSKYYYSLGVKGQDVKADPMLSVALAAYMSGKSVNISSSNGACQGGEEKIINIRIISN